MKPFIHILSILMLASLMSCTEVIELDLNNGEAQYVIEANLNANTGELQVQLSESGSFTDPGDYTLVSNAQILLTDNNGNNWSVEEHSEGIYRAENIQTMAGESLNLEVQVGGESFRAVSVVPSPVTVDSVTFIEVTGPQQGSGRSPVIFYGDPAESDLFFQVKTRIGSSPQAFSVIPLENAVDGGRIALFQAAYDTGTALELEVRSVSEPVYRYLSEVSELKGESVGPTSTAPSNPEYQWTDHVLGYFSVWYADRVSVIVP